MITSTSFHLAVTSWLTQWEVTALSYPRQRQPAFPEALTYRRESNLIFIQATGFILDISNSSLVAWSRHINWCSTADMTLRILFLVFSSPFYGFHMFLEISALISLDRKQIPPHTCCSISTWFVSFLFLLNRTPGVWQKKPSRSSCSLLCQSPLVLLSASLREWRLYQLFNDTFCACKATAFSSVETPWYLNGIKQMWWVEYRLNGRWSGSVISPSTLHDVCCWIKETGVLSIRVCCSGILSSMDLCSESWSIW